MESVLVAWPHEVASLLSPLSKVKKQPVEEDGDQNGNPRSPEGEVLVLELL